MDEKDGNRKNFFAFVKQRMHDCIRGTMWLRHLTFPFRFHKELVIVWGSFVTCNSKSNIKK